MNPGSIREILRERPALVALFVLLALGLLVPGGHQKYVLLGLSTGGAYALIAVGYTMVYGVIELINFAHGEVYMLGAYLTLTFSLAGAEAFSNPLQVSRGLKLLALLFGWVFFVVARDLCRDRFSRTKANLVALGVGGIFAALTYALSQTALPLAVACFAAVLWCSVLGVFMELVAYRPLRRAPRLAALITAIGLSLVLQNLAQWIWSPANQGVPSRLVPGFLQIVPVQDAVLAKISFLEGLERYGVGMLGGGRLTSIQVSLLVVTALLMLGLHALNHRTSLGRALRACAQDRDAAYLMGVDVDRVISWTFAIGSALGAIAGILVAFYEFNVAPQMGYKAGVMAFSAAVLGGIGNIPGALVGGIILGVAQAMAVYLEISQWDIGISYAVMIAIILVQPEGLLGAQTPRKS